MNTTEILIIILAAIMGWLAVISFLLLMIAGGRKSWAAERQAELNAQAGHNS